MLSTVLYSAILAFAVSAQNQLPAGVTKIAPVQSVPFCTFGGITQGTGQQLPNGGVMCNSTPQGLIPDVNKMISSFISKPESGSTVDASKDMAIEFTSINLMSGFSTNPDTEFMIVPQTLDPQNGLIQGHQQIVIQALGDAKLAPDASKPDFFQAVNTKSDANGRTTFQVNVPAGSLKANGVYRICTIAAAASHQPTIMAVAQRGAQDDCIRVTVTGANGGAARRR
ncbi:hypothetical protein BC833DRAFT_583574 [Globomyces pollinis-pini]|nr:hypothetical protein BC833DRAFT_583574 [Globomyces pollinis-pini]